MGGRVAVLILLIFYQPIVLPWLEMLNAKYHKIQEGGGLILTFFDSMIPDKNCRTLQGNLKVTFCVLNTVDGV